VRQSAEAKRIRVLPVLDTRIGTVRGDPNRLQQVLWNLLSNAIKFTPKGGRVQVVLERVSSHVEISVSDNGIGIPANFLPYVFERFRQADASTTRRFGGLGIGLSLVKTLVEMHGGSVRVKSPGENQGSTFSVALPIAHVDRDEHDRAHNFKSGAGSAGTPQLPRLDNVRILVVDDEPDGRDLIARILQDRGAKPQPAESGAHALRLLSEQSFDLLLSDIGMAAMDGFELIRRVRALDENRDSPLPAIAITAYARPEDRQRSLLAGFHMHLSKPIDPSELVASVAGLLHLSR
jgi:CheY-like chemotaxis protein